MVLTVEPGIDIVYRAAR